MPKDACYHKVVARYGPKTSAYRSGAMAKCRKVGAANWGNKSKKEKAGLASSLMSDVYGSGRKLKKKQFGGPEDLKKSRKRGEKMLKNIKKKAKKVARKVGRFSPVTLGKELRRKMSKK